MLALLALVACRGDDTRRSSPDPAPRPLAPTPADRCGDFVSFAFSCGIGRPPRDPTVDEGTQRNNDLVIMLGVIDQCKLRRPPYDEALITCFVDAHGDCNRYSACADAAVAARRK